MTNQNRTNETLISVEIGWVNTRVSFICDFFLFRLTAYSLRKPLQNTNKQIDVHSSSKNGFIQRNSFCGLDVAASKGYFCSVQPGAAWGQAPGGQGGRGAGSVVELAILRVYREFLCLREMLYR